MSLTLTANTLAVGPTLNANFLGLGGTAPYTYSVIPDGVGGSVNASSGVYTAPAAYGSDILQVEDSLGATATATVMVGSPLELFCDIIQTELSLASGQVYLYDQKINTPNDSRLYVAVGVLSCKPFGNSITYDGSGSGLVQVQSVNMMALLSVDVFSRSIDALNRKEEIILALQSTYAQSQQELNSFYVAKISEGFVNLSETDGAAIPYRFNISVAVQYMVKKTKAVGYYDTFADPTQVVES